PARDDSRLPRRARGGRGATPEHWPAVDGAGRLRDVLPGRRGERHGPRGADIGRDGNRALCRGSPRGEPAPPGRERARGARALARAPARRRALRARPDDALSMVALERARDATTGARG